MPSESGRLTRGASARAHPVGRLPDEGLLGATETCDQIQKRRWNAGGRTAGVQPRRLYGKRTCRLHTNMEFDDFDAQAVQLSGHGQVDIKLSTGSWNPACGGP